MEGTSQGVGLQNFLRYLLMLFSETNDYKIRIVRIISLFLEDKRLFIDLCPSVSYISERCLFLKRLEGLYELVTVIFEFSVKTIFNAARGMAIFLGNILEH